jgi:hypothetical protein
MTTEKQPTAYGVFKPVGHVVVALPTAADCDQAQQDMKAAGFVDADIVRFTPQQMIDQVEADLARASPLSGIGQEINLVKAHGELARQGSHFLVVRASAEREIAAVTEVAEKNHASRAQRYGTLIIEDLIDVGDSDHQVAESTARGLDAQTPTGEEDTDSARTGTTPIR